MPPDLKHTIPASLLPEIALDQLEPLLSKLGLPAIPDQVSLLHQAHEQVLYRLVYPPRSYVLKCYLGRDAWCEPQAYQLLSRLGVPILPLHACTANALLLEDLQTSPDWRLATEDDLMQETVGVAVADWYRQLHAAGTALLEQQPAPNWLMPPESDCLTPANILSIGARLELEALPVWELAAQHLTALQSAFHRQPLTLNYNDFHWTNLALSRNSDPNPRAIIFDYHLLGTGMRYSDLRNVSGELGDTARKAFFDHYGPVNRIETLLDAPLSLLYGLQDALERPRLPPWAQSLVAMVSSGDLEACLHEALTLLD